MRGDGDGRRRRRGWFRHCGAQSPDGEAQKARRPLVQKSFYARHGFVHAGHTLPEWISRMARRIRRRYQPRPLTRWMKPVWMQATLTLHVRLAMLINASHPRAMPFALRTGAADIGGMRMLALRTGLNRESLYRALAPDGNPTLHTLDRVLAVFGLRLAVAPIEGAKPMLRHAPLHVPPTARRGIAK